MFCFPIWFHIVFLSIVEIILFYKLHRWNIFVDIVKEFVLCFLGSNFSFVNFCQPLIECIVFCHCCVYFFV